MLRTARIARIAVTRLPTRRGLAATKPPEERVGHEARLAVLERQWQQQENSWKSAASTIFAVSMLLGVGSAFTAHLLRKELDRPVYPLTTHPDV
jgi:hypothetical protein